MSRLLRLLSVIALAGFAVSAFASPIPIDSLQEKVLKPRKSATVRGLRDAYDRLREKKFAQALSRALSAQKQKDSRDYGDYIAWIAANAEIGLARTACSEAKHELCGQLSRSSASRLLKIMELYPYSPFVKGIQKEIATAELVIAQSLCGGKKWTSCRDKLEGALQRLSAAGALGLVRPEHLQAYGEACGKNSGELCLAWIQKLASFFPRSSSELKALARTSGVAIERQRPSFASGRATRSYKAPDPDQVAFDAAMSLYFEQKWSDAIKAFRQFLDDYPRSAHRYRAQYWMAQAFGQDQKHEEAQKTYEQLRQETPLTYYGLLASIALGVDVGSTIDARVPYASPTDPFLAPHELVRLRRAEAMIAGQAFSLAALELKEIRARESLSSPFLMYLAMLNHLAKSHSVAFSLVGELIQRGYDGVFSSYVLRLIFPAPYQELIDKFANDAKLDPMLVLSLMKQESAFEASVASGAGAQGLMQLMHATALDVFPDLARWELAEAETNVRAGTRYLSRLMTKFNGNIVLALAGYNAGPAAVDRWLKNAPAKRGMLEFIEAIPYRETREYVAAIIRNYYWYSRNLDQKMPRTLGYFWNVYGPAESRVKPVSTDSGPPESTGENPAADPASEE